MLGRERTFQDPALGDLVRRRGWWRGSIDLDRWTGIPLVVAGSRSTPSERCLAAARVIPGSVGSWRTQLEPAVFEHFSEAAPGGGEHVPSYGTGPGVDRPDQVWERITPRYIAVSAMRGAVRTEFGFGVSWDDEHTLGGRFEDGRLVELNGSVAPP